MLVTRLPLETPAVGRPAATEERPIAVIFQRLGPYHHARLAAAARLRSLIAVEACGMDETYAWDRVEEARAFEKVTLSERRGNGRAWRRQVCLELARQLDRLSPSLVVVPGWSEPEALGALAWSVRRWRPAVMMSESTAWDEPRVPWREWVKGRIVQLCSAALVGGRPHADYMAQLGVVPDRVVAGYDAVDNDHFASLADKARARAVEQRKRLGLPERFFLASARFVEKKNLPGLIEAYRRYRVLADDHECKGESRQPWDLVLLGDGPLKARIVGMISDAGLSQCVHLPGFRQYDELPAYYGLASAFVHASTTEQWGLVVNEAMASGLPVLVSNRCGCASDLVREGINGYSFEPGDTEQLAQLMRRFSNGAEDLERLGKAGRQIIAEWGPERFGRGLAQAVQTAMDLPVPRVGWLDRLLLWLLLRR